MSVKYVNLGEIFPLNIREENIKFFKIPGLNRKPEYTNYCLIITDVYKFPERVLEYAKSLSYTNTYSMVQSAPVIRTNAPFLPGAENAISRLVTNYYGRIFRPTKNQYQNAVFSYYSPKSIDYHIHHEPHTDNEPEEYHILAGLCFLENTYGTSIMKNKYYSDYDVLNKAYYPEGNNSHWEEVFYIEGLANSMVFYFGCIPHMPDYKRASDNDRSNGRIVQNFFLEDITLNHIENETKSLNIELNKISKQRLYNQCMLNLMNHPKSEYKIYSINDPRINLEYDYIVKKYNGLKRKKRFFTEEDMDKMQIFNENDKSELDHDEIFDYNNILTNKNSFLISEEDIKKTFEDDVELYEKI